MTARQRAGALGALAGVVAIGAAAGLAAERYAVGRTRLRPDPEAREDFFQLPPDRGREVVTNDGVRLHVEEVGPEEPAGPTIVFAHGYTQEMAVWHYQRQAFAADNPGKLVFYDHRSHGRSGRSHAGRSTIDQLGRDLHAVLQTCAPRGPVVLVGHSMGGMTIMALADQRPELFGTRITAVALLSTSTGKLAEAAFGLPSAVVPVTNRVLPFVTRGMRNRPEVFERGRRLGTDLAFLISRSWAFGTKDVSPSLVEFVERMLANTPVDVIAEFYDTFTDHDKLAALDVLDRVETLILVGSKDKLTPLSHSQLMATALPSAQLVVVEGAGHMVQLERAPLVTLHLRALLRRAASSVARSA
jgi:pimeloyl-ACP methyl ester carboxylesterase